MSMSQKRNTVRSVGPMSQAYGLQVWKLGLPTQLAAGYTFSDYGDLVLPLMGVLKLMA